MNLTTESQISIHHLIPQLNAANLFNSSKLNIVKVQPDKSA